MKLRIRLLTALALAICAGAARADWDAGVAAFKAKNYPQAQKEFEVVVRERPDWSGGYLMLGHSESLLNLSTAFELVHLRDDLVYRKPVGAERLGGA